MWTTAYRDATLVESPGRIMDESWLALLSRAVDVLAAGRPQRGRRGAAARAALRIAVDFRTWRTLTHSGLDDHEAAAVTARFVEAADVSSSRSPRRGA